MKFTLLQTDVRTPNPKGRGKPLTFHWLVLEGSDPVAIFRSEYKASAYVKRLNQLQGAQ